MRLLASLTFSLFTPLLAPLGLFAAPPAACVSVWQPTTPDGRTEGGSGTVIACEAGKSLIVTNNHVMSSARDRFGRFMPPAVGSAATVKHGDKAYPGKVLAASQELDLCAVEVDAVLPAAELASDDAAPGTKVTRHGIGSGEQPGTVVPFDPKYVSPSMHFVARGRSESGDSGAAYFDADGRVVAVHCGTDGVNPRGTPVSHVRVWVKEVAGPRFPRLAKVIDRVRGALARLWGRPEVKVEPVPVVTPKVAAVVVTTYRQVLVRDRYGRLWWAWEPVTAGASSGCPGGVCPLPKR